MIKPFRTRGEKNKGKKEKEECYCRHKELTGVVDFTARPRQHRMEFVVQVY